ncbi:MAG: DNA-binding protein Alba [Candidatus Diapherotrites archaeon]|nr:DNA-binding protein Alba [Candidatus Diapherotrites archaeon]
MADSAENQVFIGKKGVMSYVLAVVTQFNTGVKEVTVKARGKAISRAVDVTEIVRHRFLADTKVKDISISTEELSSDGGESNRVSAIEITLSR